MDAMAAPAEGADTAAPTVPFVPSVPSVPVDHEHEKSLVDFLHDAQSAAVSVKGGNAADIEKVLVAIVAALDHEHCHHGHL